MPASPTTRKRKQGHERIMLSAKQRARGQKAGDQWVESSPADTVVIDPEAHAVRRAIEDRALEREIEDAGKSGWED